MSGSFISPNILQANLIWQWHCIYMILFQRFSHSYTICYYLSNFDFKSVIQYLSMYIDIIIIQNDMSCKHSMSFILSHFVCKTFSTHKRANDNHYKQSLYIRLKYSSHFSTYVYNLVTKIIYLEWYIVTCVIWSINIRPVDRVTKLKHTVWSKLAQIVLEFCYPCAVCFNFLV